MKTKYFFIVLLFMHGNIKAEVVCKLSEALQKKLVNIKVRGTTADTAYRGEYSTHYGPCMAMEILSTSADALNINLDYGYKLEPEDSSLQTMMVTQTLTVKLQPKQEKSCRIYAMCTEATDGGPTSTATFYLRKRVSGNLLGLAEMFDRKKYQGEAAQAAVWCLTNNHDLRSIFSNDTTMMYELRRFIIKAKGISPEKIYEKESYNSLPVATYATRSVYSGSLHYRFSGTSKVLVALFDEDNHMKRVYVNNEVQREGDYTYNYQIGSDEMSNKKHYLRLFRNGKLEEEISIIPGE